MRTQFQEPKTITDEDAVIRIATDNAVGALRQFVEQRFAGKTDNAHKSIKDYYVKEIGYGKVETAIEEIACDLYAEDLILTDKTEQAEVGKVTGVSNLILNPPRNKKVRSRGYAPKNAVSQLLPHSHTLSPII